MKKDSDHNSTDSAEIEALITQFDSRKRTLLWIVPAENGRENQARELWPTHFSRKGIINLNSNFFRSDSTLERSNSHEQAQILVIIAIRRNCIVTSGNCFSSSWVYSCKYISRCKSNGLQGFSGETAFHFFYSSNSPVRIRRKW